MAATLEQIKQGLSQIKLNKADIKQAIERKGQEVTTFGTYAEAISKINTTQADTADATAVAGDLAGGKTAYVNGAKITGTLVEKTDGQSVTTTDVSEESSYVYLTVDTDTLIRNGGSVRVSNAVLAQLVGLTGDIIVEGHTILGVVGTHTEEGTDTSDATATAGDMASGVTAYVNGEKLTGTVDVVESSQQIVGASAEDKVGYTLVHVGKDVLIRNGGAVSVTDEVLAEAISVDASIIKAGEQVLGIEGTFEGNYDEIKALIDDILDVTPETNGSDQEGEEVPVEG